MYGTMEPSSDPTLRNLAFLPKQCECVCEADGKAPHWLNTFTWRKQEVQNAWDSGSGGGYGAYVFDTEELAEQAHGEGSPGNGGSSPR